MNYYSHKYFTSLCFGNDIDLIDSCILPDEDEAQNGFSCHFYNPVTKKCFLGTEDSAKNRFIWHLSNYLHTKKKESLGRAIHFLEDICTPVHTQYEDAIDAAIRLNLHINFEKALDLYLENYYGSIPDMQFKSVCEILDYCSIKSSELYYLVRDKNATNTVCPAVLSFTKSALFSLYDILQKGEIVAKSFVIQGEKINVLFENKKILPSCLNTNYCLRFNGIDNVVVYHRENKLTNFNVIGNLI